MIGFKLFCEIAKNGPMLVTQTSDQSDCLTDARRLTDQEIGWLDAAIERARVFVFMGVETDFAKVLEEDTLTLHFNNYTTSGIGVGFAEEIQNQEGENAVRLKEQKMDLPFECCWFEIIDPATHQPTPVNDYWVKNKNEPETMELRIQTLGVLAEEVAPGQYREWSLLRRPGGKTGIHLTHRVSNKEIDGYLGMIDRGRVASETVRERIKIGTGKTKRTHTIRQIIRVFRKSEIATARPAFSREIDWTHRWEVRGHWRTVSGIGKNREGEYCIPGFTWVKDFVKGPDDKPLVKKIRLVEPEKKEQSSGE